MAYNNPYYYNRSSSISDNYTYVDATTFSPIYGSSVDFSSRINIIPTSDNTLKILPASENNLAIRYKLRFALNDTDTGNLLKTIEIAAGVKYLKFNDPSGIYKSIVGYVEDYSVNKNTKGNLNEITISLASYTSSPLFNWKTSSLINVNIGSFNPRIESAQTFKQFDIVYLSSAGVNINTLVYNLPYNFDQSYNGIDDEIYYVDDSSIEIGGFKYFFPFKISTKIESESIPNSNTNWNESSKIWYLKSKTELILSQTDSSTAVKKLSIQSYNLVNKKFTTLTSFNTSEKYYSFKNANDLYLIKDGEQITFLSNGLISTSAVNSYIYIYKYNFQTNLIEIHSKIEPLKLFENVVPFYSYNAVRITLTQYNTIRNYTLKIISPTSSCYSNGKLYFIAQINFNYLTYTTPTYPFRCSCILALDIAAKTYTLAYIGRNEYVTSSASSLNSTLAISSISVDDATGFVHFVKGQSHNAIYKATNIYSTQTLSFNAAYLNIKSFIVKNNNAFVIGSGTSGSKQVSKFTIDIGKSLYTKIELNEIDNFLIAKEDGILFSSLTRNFFFDPKLAFDFKNKFDFKQLDYRNSFIQNVKYKENENTLKQFNLKFENISTAQCKAMLFFLEKKCGYRRFMYDFPIFFKTKKVFICTEWSHTFKYHDCHDLNLLLIEDPNPNIRIPPAGEYSDYLLIKP